MAFPPQKILFPVDFSDRAPGVSRFVEALTGRFEEQRVEADPVLSV